MRTTKVQFFLGASLFCCFSRKTDAIPWNTSRKHEGISERSALIVQRLGHLHDAEDVGSIPSRGIVLFAFCHGGMCEKWAETCWKSLEVSCLGKQRMWREISGFYFIDQCATLFKYGVSDFQSGTMCRSSENRKSNFATFLRVRTNK